MPYQIAEEKIVRKELMETDPSGETWVDIKEADWDAQLERSRVLAHSRVEYTDQGETATRITELSKSQMKTVEIALVLSDSNILDAKGKPLFKSRMSREQISLALGKIRPPRIVEEIYQAVIEVNPDWAPEGNEGDNS
jgi:hypothetical protein